MNVDTAYRVSPLHRGDPEWLGRYELSGRLGVGGMGVVYLALDEHGGYVAIKLVHESLAHDAEFRGRFRSEVERARQVPAFCTAEVLDADLDHNPPYLVVEYVDGPSLSEVIEDRGPLKANNLHSLAVGVASALAGIHGAGVIHRDLKPQNVLLAPGSPKVIDFGIARAFEATSQYTRTDQMVGTVAYMAPERFSSKPGGDLSPAVDIFAWGCVVGYAGTGRTPFNGDSPPATAARILTQPPDLDGMAEPLRSLCEMALAKDPEERPTAHELLDMLVSDRPLPPRRSMAAVGAPPAPVAIADVPEPVRPAYEPEPYQPARANTVTSHKPGRSRRQNGGSWLAFLAVLLVLGGVVTFAAVQLFGPDPGGDAKVAAGSTPTSGGGAAAAGGVNFPDSSLPASSGAAKPADPAGVATTLPPEPVGGTVLLADPLTAPGKWLDSEIKAQQANCFANGVMQAGRVDRGTYQCVGPKDEIADAFDLRVTVQLKTAGSCAAVWFHWQPNVGGHLLKVCQAAMSVGADKPEDHRVYGALPLSRQIPLGKSTEIHLLSQDSQAKVWRDGYYVGSVALPAGEPATGQALLGISVDTTTDPAPYQVTFSAVEIRQR